ncbi:MAG: hypothetical protein HC921_05090 [Synechococcaceae cyanobacterium SM2_3_1]|nr:hypothetical protein [Synechococcaceae cyanobacterium SM2_3_1]
MSGAFNVEQLLEEVLGKLRTLAETGQTFGKPITVGEITIVPFMSLNFGLGGAGGEQGFVEQLQRGKRSDHPQNTLWGGAGGGVRVEPLGFLVIRGERVEIMTLEQQPNSWDKLADTVIPLLQQWQETQQRPADA